MTADRPLRVLCVVPDLRVGGAERHAVTLLPRLDRKRFDPSVICIGSEGDLFPALAAGYVPALALKRTKLQAVGALCDLVRETRRIAPDIMIVRGFNAETLGRIAAFLARVPRTVVWVHNCGETTTRSVLRRIVDRALAPVTSAYFGVAKLQVPYLVDDLHIPPRKIRIIHNGVDPAQFDPRGDRAAAADLGIGPRDRVVGILAALRPEKDHATLLRAARLVVDELPDAKFLVVGDGPTRGDLERLAGELGIADRVVFTGSRPDVRDLLGVMDVFVLSSYSVECFPMALLEAMAAGRPAVCTAVGGVPEMISEGVTGFLVPPRAPTALAEKLLRVLTDPETSREMGLAARTRVESEFSLRASVAESERALEEVAGRCPPRGARPIRLSLVLDLTFVGGVELLMLELFRNLDPRVVRPRLICLREAGPLGEEFRRAGFDVEVLERSGRYDVRTLPRLIRSLRRDRTDAVLVTHHHRAALALGRIAARIAGVRANIVAAHDMDLTSVGKRCLPRSTVETLWLSDALVLLAPRQGEYLRREEGVGRFAWRRTREVVIPNGIVLPPLPRDTDRERARAAFGLDQQDFVVGIVGRLSSQKAHQVLFEAISAVAASGVRVRLVVIGGGERDDELRTLATELGISGRTRFMGVRRDVQQLLPGLDVSCLSSVHEGVPIIAIESMAAGVPLVVTDCGCLRDMVTDGEQGYVVPVGDAHAMAQRLISLAADPGLCTRQGRSGRARAEQQYRIEDTARGFERLLTEVVEVR
ncbi:MULTISPECIES: glycosyltransferase [unclassified Rhodococcus (in: high G+C Gram-positive bacteria)]|uniref:glycosyltransferase n=1 Tax=unclassified Rhodococcus (in: high G+C Gram-positive bacteria) TaxID=192944 RepID=UPI000779F6AC|nr:MULTISPECIES: glycosyltransferase [unclassified Rhodococcus (in: high G+C Gram-positive bacteria)]KXX57099.1 glycosyltransferase [Rhodococcus sp. LB1]